jgi:hypothetical protein
MARVVRRAVAHRYAGAAHDHEFAAKQGTDYDDARKC